jgi:hypothetical protein
VAVAVAVPPDAPLPLPVRMPPPVPPYELEYTVTVEVELATTLTLDAAVPARPVDDIPDPAWPPVASDTSVRVALCESAALAASSLMMSDTALPPLPAWPRWLVPPLPP